MPNAPWVIKVAFVTAFNKLVTEREKASLGQELAVLVEMTQNCIAENARIAQNQGEPVAEFDERLWGAMVDYVTVGVDGGMTVVFRDGTGMDR